MPSAERKSGELSRALLLDSARRLFTQDGYAATGTRDIARAAGVPERLIFRHYGGKAGLFDAAARAQIADFIDDFVASWRERPAGSYDLGELTREFIAGFLDFADRNHRILIDLVGLRGGGMSPTEATAMSPFADLFMQLEELARTEAERHGLSTTRAGRDVRFTFGTVVSTVLFSDLLYSENFPRPPREELVGQLSAYVLGGTLPTAGW